MQFTGRIELLEFIAWSQKAAPTPAAAAPTSAAGDTTVIFDPSKVTTEDNHTNETDEGENYCTATTRVLHDGEEFYRFRTNWSSNIGGAYGQEHTAELTQK